MQVELSFFSPEHLILTLIVCATCAILAISRTRSANSGAQNSRRAGKERFTDKVGSTSIRRLADATLYITLLVIGGLLLSRLGDPIGVRADAWTEAMVAEAGRNYARVGFLQDGGVPQIQVITDTHPSDPYFLYMTFPSGMYWINGLWHALGVPSTAFQRLLPLLCSILSLFLWFRLVRGIAGDAVAAVATFVMSTSYGFLAYADHLAYHAYTMLTVIAALCCFVRAAQLNGMRSARRTWAVACAVLLFITACINFEYHIFLLTFVVGYVLLFPCKLKRRYLPIFLLPLVAAAAIQQIQRRIAFADLPAFATADIGGGGILADIYRRTIGFSSAVDTPRGLTLASYPGWLALRYYKFYGLPMVAAFAIVVMLFVRDRRPLWHVNPGATAERLCVILLTAGAGWWFVMLQHTSVHPHTMRVGMAGFALLIALAAIRSWHVLRSSAFAITARVAAAVLLLTLSYVQSEGLVTFVRAHFIERSFDSRERGDEGFAESRDLSTLRDIIPPDGVILTNHNRLAPMRLWAQRPVYNGLLDWYPPGDVKDGRRLLEMNIAHLRHLYDGHMPRLYYVYWLYPEPSMEAAFHENELLRTLVTGSPQFSPQSWTRARPLLSEAVVTGRCANTFCPIVGINKQALMLVFDFQPAVSLALWAEKSPPSLREFGPGR